LVAAVPPLPRDTSPGLRLKIPSGPPGHLPQHSALRASRGRERWSRSGCCCLLPALCSNLARWWTSG